MQVNSELALRGSRFLTTVPGRSLRPGGFVFSSKKKRHDKVATPLTSFIKIIDLFLSKSPA